MVAPGRDWWGVAHRGQDLSAGLEHAAEHSTRGGRSTRMARRVTSSALPLRATMVTEGSARHDAPGR
jgi:hypothetical protein